MRLTNLAFLLLASIILRNEMCEQSQFSLLHEGFIEILAQIEEKIVNLSFAVLVVDNGFACVVEVDIICRLWVVFAISMVTQMK